MREKKPIRKTSGRDAGPIITDPQGSYTGRPEERYEIPVQDADDL